MNIGDALVADGLITAQQLQQAQQHADGGSVVRPLVQAGVVTEEQVTKTAATQMGVPFLDVGPAAVEAEAALLLSRDTAEKYTALPVQFSGDGQVMVAVADPKTISAAKGVLSAETGMDVTFGLAVRSQLKQAIKHLAAAPAPQAPARPGSPNTSDELMSDAEVEQRRAQKAPDEAPDMDDVLEAMVELGGSDLHLTAGLPPMVRINGGLRPIDGFAKLMPDTLQQMLYSILTQKEREIFENTLELDCSYSVAGLARFRVNVFQQRDAIGAVMRIIPFEILPLDKLGIPESVADFCDLKRGLVLVTGPTGSGKSTTLASLIDLINRKHQHHIMTVEDPIEFLHNHKRSVVNQREVGHDTKTFATALKHVLRQDPDVILVGEMRDLETIEIALTAAETGHLVFGTLHTQDAPQTVDRIIDVFPPHQQEQIRVMLAGALKGVVCQQLCKTADGSGRAAAAEVMVVNNAIKNLIREGKTHQIYSMIQSGMKQGMIAMDQSLAKLVRDNKVTSDEALARAQDPKELARLLRPR